MKSTATASLAALLLAACGGAPDGDHSQGWAASTTDPPAAEAGPPPVVVPDAGFPQEEAAAQDDAADQDAGTDAPSEASPPDAQASCVAVYPGDSHGYVPPIASACNTDEDCCSGGACAQVNGSSYCIQACSYGTTCASGSACSFRPTTPKVGTTSTAAVCFTE